MLLHHQFEATAERVPNNTALVAEGVRHSYAELAIQVASLATTLAAHGVGRGDRVVAVTRNRAEMVVALYASLKAGAIFSPLGAAIKADKLAYILADCRPACIILETARPGFAIRDLPTPSELRLVLTLGALGEGAPARVDGIIQMPFDQALALPVAPVEPGTIDQDLAAILYTSGSTGQPKGVMLSHLNMRSAVESITQYLGLVEDDRILCALPLSFDYGLYQVLMASKLGARVILEQSFAFPAQMLACMQREAVSVFPGVPTMFALLMGLESPGHFHLPSLRLITNTAANLPPEHIRQIQRRFPQARLFSMYGLTECKRVSYLPPEELATRPGSVGRGMPNQEVYLVDEQGQRLPPGSTGELVVRGSHVMRGYWRKPEESAERLRPGIHPGEQVLHTGDLFRMDADGYLYFLGRKDDMLKCRGEKVAPKEIENLLHRLEGVLEAAVVGLPDALLGHALKAFLVLKPGHRYGEKEILRFCGARLERHMVPREIAFVDALPRSPNGKVDKQALVRWEQEQEQEQEAGRSSAREADGALKGLEPCAA